MEAIVSYCGKYVSFIFNVYKITVLFHLFGQNSVDMEILIDFKDDVLNVNI
jgi:hypothetical protein